MNQGLAPLVEALAEYHRVDRYGFTPPAHREGRGVDDRTRQVIGADAFRADLDPADLPRDAFFGPAEHLPADVAIGRVAAEQLTPCPPGIPAILPGERITADVLDYLRTGLTVGMVRPDAADPELSTIRVVRQ